MSQYDWIDMMNTMQDFRLFCSLHIRRVKKGGIASAQELDVLSRIALSEKPLTPQELSKTMGVNKSAVSRVVDHLGKKSFLVKQPNSSDKRSYTLSLTEYGNRELNETYRYYLEPIYTLRRTLGEEDFQALAALIRKSNNLLQALPSLSSHDIP